MIALNICVLLNWPSGGAIDLGAESFGLEADDAPLGGGAGREHVIFAPDAVDASIVYCVHRGLPLRRPTRPDANRRLDLEN